VKAQNAFMAREVFALSLDRLYRVYASPAELVFVKVGGQAGLSPAVAIQFGLIGAFVHRWFEKRAKMRMAAEVASMDRRDLRGLLARDKVNFSIRAADVVRSAIDPPSGFPTHGPRIGKWRLQATDGTIHDLQFEDVEDMKTAIEALHALLGGVQRVNVRWDGDKRRYVELT
jgi:hypothetical protein